MKQRNSLILIISIAILTIGYALGLNFGKDKTMISEQIKSIDDVKKLFPQTPQAINDEIKQCIEETKSDVQEIIAIPGQNRSFANTAAALDDVLTRSNTAIKESVISGIEYLHPDKVMRDAAHQAVKEVSDFLVDAVYNNKKLYAAFKEYAQGNALHEDLNPEQKYFIKETLKSFERAGLELPDDQLENVKKLKKELNDLSLAFDRNIADDARTICVSKKDLAGCTDEFINNLTQNGQGDYILGVDYPTYFYVMEHCDVEKTRKELFDAFSSRAYPANRELLKKIVAVRHELAQALGYESYAALNIDNQMASTVSRVDSFLHDLRTNAQAKTEHELHAFCQELPSSVCITQDGKINAWDLGRIKTYFKNKHFQIDERKIAEYFPMQHTIDSLLDIYEQFLGVAFKEKPVKGLWHDDVRLVEVYTKDRSQLLGYLFLDLHPRSNKYSHAAHLGVVPAITKDNGTRLPAVSIVMANFPKASSDRPSLLMRNDVSTFFHEFGHALHAMLGATELGSFAGTHVKTDFVEMPSQMLEEWLWDKEILKKVSKHYKTGESLPDQMIDNIIALKRYDAGNFVTRQTMLAQYALDLYKPGADKDPEALWYQKAETILPQINWGPNYKMFASFGHLTGYGAKYYGYLWSKVFALDLFDTIKKHGLLNPEIGTRYVTHVIGKGGSCDPNDLLCNFLGRQPSQEAFFKDMGIRE